MLCLCPVGCLSIVLILLVWYRQIWIQTFLGFIVSDLIYIHINICSFQEHNLDLNKCQNVNLPSKHSILSLYSPIPKLTTYSDQDPSFYACHHVTPSVHINSLYDCSNIFSRWLNLICSTKKHWAADCWLLSSIFTIMKLHGAESQYETDLCPFHSFIPTETRHWMRHAWIHKAANFEL